MSIFGGGPRDEDSDDRAINRSRKPAKKPKCFKKYKTKDAKGNTVTRTCIKNKGHWGKHA